MKLITKEIKRLLDSNKKRKPEDRLPYLKLFNPVGSATWLISEYNESNGLLYGLCDLGLGFPELGYVGLDELESIELPLGMKIERDIHWTPEKSVVKYLDETREGL